MIVEKLNSASVKQWSSLSQVSLCFQVSEMLSYELSNSQSKLESVLEDMEELQRTYGALLEQHGHCENDKETFQHKLDELQQVAYISYLYSWISLFCMTDFISRPSSVCDACRRPRVQFPSRKFSHKRSTFDQEAVYRPLVASFWILVLNVAAYQDVITVGIRYTCSRVGLHILYNCTDVLTTDERRSW